MNQQIPQLHLGQRIRLVEALCMEHGREVDAEPFDSTTGRRARCQGILDPAALDAAAARELRSHPGSLRASGMAFTRDELVPCADPTCIIRLAAIDDSHPIMQNA